MNVNLKSPIALHRVSSFQTHLSQNEQNALNMIVLQALELEYHMQA